MRAGGSAGHARLPHGVLSGEEVPPLHIVNTCFGPGEVVQGERPLPVTPASLHGLSVRAVNVLKMLADEIMGEVPPQDDWAPSDELLRKITAERLSITRNCGPRTVDEIIRWAEARGVKIQPVFHAGKSLSETWRDLAARFSSGELTRAELAEALEKSVRRKSTKIPVAAQRILLKFLSGAGADVSRT